MRTACCNRNILPKPTHSIVQRVPSHPRRCFPFSWFGLTAQIATVVPCPSVKGSSKQIYMKTTPRLVIEGSNFNITNTELVFDPPLNASSPDLHRQVRINTTTSVKLISLPPHCVLRIRCVPLAVHFPRREIHFYAKRQTYVERWDPTSTSRLGHLWR